MRNCIGVILLCSMLAGAQTPPAGSADTGKDVVFSVSTTVIQVDAEVTDKHGHHVNDLKASDFEVLLDKKPQQISNFSYVSLDSPDVNKRALNSSETVARPQDVRRCMVFLVDDLNLSFEQTYQLKRSLHDWVDHEMRPGDLVAIWQTLHFNSVFQELTSDKRTIEAAIDAIHWSVLRDVFARGEYGNYGSSVAMLNSLEELIAELRPVGGRKAVVILAPGVVVGGAAFYPNAAGSGSFVSADAELIRAFQNLIDSANRTGTVIYGVDTQGPTPTLDSTLYRGQAGMRSVTEPTGGFAVVNTNANGFAPALKEIADDQRGYYSIAFHAPDDIRTNKSGKVDYKRLRVRVLTPGLRVRSREGFLGETDEAAAPVITPDERLRLALRSLFNQTDIAVRLSPFYTQNDQGQPWVHNMIYIDAKQVKFVDQPNGKHEAKLDLMAVASGLSMTPLASVSKKIVLDADDKQVADIRRDGLLFAMDVRVPHPGAYQVRASVRDENSDALGSAGEYIPIPNLKEQEIALTTPLVDNASLPSGERYKGISAAVRDFGPGTVLDFVSVLETAKNIQPAGVTGTLQLLHDGATVVTTPVRLVPVQGQNSYAFTGSIKLNSSMPAGRYYLQLNAQTQQGKKPAQTTGFTSFDVSGAQLNSAIAPDENTRQR